MMLLPLPKPTQLSANFRESRLILVTVLLGAIYVMCRLSPSSYSLVLQRDFQAAETGLIVGTPRGIRMDEWSHFTPWTQAVVNNNFSRFNRYSPYHEDFRTVFPMPIFDWALVAKPHMWLYLVAPPDYAFAAYWFVMMAAFIVGFTLLLKRIGVSEIPALVTALTAFCSGFTQYWWTNNCGAMAFLPWVGLAALSSLPLLWKCLVFGWACAVWLLALFYPPFIIQFAFVLAVILLAFSGRSKIFHPRNLIPLGLSAAAAVTLVVWYLINEILAIANTVVPGERRFDGGGMGWRQYLGHFFPTSHIANHESLIGANICEVSVLGSFLPLLALCFADHQSRKWREREFLYPLSCLLGGFLLISAWQLLPLPKGLGSVLLWDRIHPNRMGFSSGLLATLASIWILSQAGARLTVLRFFCFATAVIGVFFQTKVKVQPAPWEESWVDVIILLPIACLLPFARRIGQTGIVNTLLLAALATNVIAFAGFNPLQSTIPIFRRPQTEVTRQLDSMLAAQGGKRLAVPQSMGFPGAVLTGWGYPSVSHAMFAPHLDYWQRIFPEIQKDEIRQIFGRSGHIILKEDRLRPEGIHATIVAVPLVRFLPKNPYRLRAVAFSRSELPLETPSGTQPTGFVEHAELQGEKLVLSGWARWQGVHKKQQLVVITSGANLSDPRIITVQRPDVVHARGKSEFIHSGFRAEFQLSSKEEGKPLKFCVLGEDKQRKESFVLMDSKNGLSWCQELIPDAFVQTPR